MVRDGVAVALMESDRLWVEVSVKVGVADWWCETEQEVD